MNTYDDGRDPTAELLSQTLSQEAATVDPNPGALQAIQQRTADKKPARRRWVLGTFGAGLATAAVITTIVLVSGSGPDRSGTPAAGQPHGGTVQPSGMHDGVYDPTADSRAQETMYYVGPQPADPTLSPRLFTEPHTVQPTDGTPDVAAVHEFLTSTPIDPDYSSGWPEGVDVSGITTDSGTTTIALEGDADLSQPGDLTRRQAEMAIQALLYTAGDKTAAAFTYNDQPLTTLLGVDVSTPVALASENDERAWISIDNIVEGQTVASPVTVKISGNVYEGNINWTLKDSSDTVVDTGFVTTSMGMWTQADADLGTLAPGTYTFEGVEYSGEDGSTIANSDSKTFTVQ